MKQRLRGSKTSGPSKRKVAKAYHEPRTADNALHHGGRNQPWSYPSRLRLHARAVKQIGETSPLHARCLGLCARSSAGCTSSHACR